MTINTSKKTLLLTLVALVVLLVVSNIFWLQKVLECATTKGYTADHVHYIENKNTAILRVANLQVIGKNKEAVLALLDDDYFIKDGCIVTGNICLLLDNDIVVAIKNDNFDK